MAPCLALVLGCRRGRVPIGADHPPGSTLLNTGWGGFKRARWQRLSVEENVQLSTEWLERSGRPSPAPSRVASGERPHPLAACVSPPPPTPTPTPVMPVEPPHGSVLREGLLGVS